MMWMYLGFFLIGSAAAQVPVLGVCPQVDVKTDFDTTKFLGKWYEAERYFLVFELGGKCVTATYALNENGTVAVENRQISSLSGVISSIAGYAFQKSNDKAKLSVMFPSLPVQFEAPYWVLDTDYDSYAVIWSCNNFGIFSLRNAWILTRDRRPAVSVLEKAYQVLHKNKISRAFLTRTDQKNCPEDSAITISGNNLHQISANTSPSISDNNVE